MTQEDFQLLVEPTDIRIVIDRFEKKWLGDSVSGSSSPSFTYAYFSNT
jgi:hypothetical protein